MVPTSSLQLTKCEFQLSFLDTTSPFLAPGLSES